MTRTLPPWTPFARGNIQQTPAELRDTAEKIARDFGVPTEMALAQVEAIARDEAIWINSRYQVNIRRGEHVDGQSEGWPEMIHLSIKRLDKQPLGPEHYRDLMRIKDELVGPEHEGVELYPARSREADSANQLHLWILARDDVSFPFGFRGGRHVRELPNGVGSAGARQAPFEAHQPHD